MTDRSPVLIVGAGIAGLATAIALTRRGFSVEILERRTQLSEAGAGIQIGPNGVRALEALGLRSKVEAVAFQPAALSMYLAASGAGLTRLPFDRLRSSAPYLTLLRSELQSVLLDAVRASAGARLTLGFESVEIESGDGAVTARSADGRGVSGQGLIGADGLWSRVRQRVDLGALPATGPSRSSTSHSVPILKTSLQRSRRNEQEGDERLSPQRLWPTLKNDAPSALHPAGYIAYRAVIARAGLPPPFDAPEVGLWLGPKAHLVHYPVAGGALLNLVVIVAGNLRSDDWDEPGAPAELARQLDNWPGAARAVLQSVPQWRRWTLYDLPELAHWSHGHVVLIGDAAHPVLPFLAQGAVMALEDAVALARLVEAAGGMTPGALAQFERVRRARVSRLAAAARGNGRTYHLSGAAAAARDVVLRLTPPALLLRRFDWLYGFDPAAAPKP